jgi:hypothetical protein
MQLDQLRREIDRMRVQIGRQRKDIRSLQQADIPTTSAEELLARMLATVDRLSAERDVIIREERVKYPGTDKAIKGSQRRSG